ncbi:hypothetical protein M5J20_05520 [Corynebacterium sp. TA-R-1]|uniref:Uncharacterized protein n=1 Tax=Corynebacterium stercoris TaxID=2943490 RepID=A0ABT1G4K7_9CORY|nr:hypothetical protein [Corynebacterium stercoris]MCP1387647.1 hypothetical protein [Corynebacterium stercoris]
MAPEPRQRRRARRVADVDYDRTADTAPEGVETAADAERVVELDEFADEQLTGKEFYESERPPHHGD